MICCRLKSSNEILMKNTSHLLDHDLSDKKDCSKIRTKTSSKMAAQRQFH